METPKRPRPSSTSATPETPSTPYSPAKLVNLENLNKESKKDPINAAYGTKLNWLQSQHPTTPNKKIGPALGEVGQLPASTSTESASSTNKSNPPPIKKIKFSRKASRKYRKPSRKHRKTSC
jgi:hypothetical protein